MGGVASGDQKRIRPLFSKERVAANAGFFLEGLLSDGTQDRLDAGGGSCDPGPWRQQAILGAGTGMLMLCVYRPRLCHRAFGG